MYSDEPLTLKIVQSGDPILRNPARDLTVEEILDPSTQTLIKLMRKTMRDAPGVGLAATQVGLGIRLIVIEDRPEYLAKLTDEELETRKRVPIDFQVLINPVLTIIDNSQIQFYETCLSVTGYMARVPRAESVRVEALDASAQPVSITAEGWYARILQHEIDHLDGHLYIDRMDSTTLTTEQNFMRFSTH